MHRNIIVRLVTYYLAIILLLSGLFYAFPLPGRCVAAARASQGVGALLDLAAVIRGIEQGDPHVTKVELTRSKSKATTDG